MLWGVQAAAGRSSGFDPRVADLSDSDSEVELDLQHAEGPTQTGPSHGGHLLVSVPFSRTHTPCSKTPPFSTFPLTPRAPLPQNLKLPYPPTSLSDAPFPSSPHTSAALPQ